jgi:glyoxylase-like metal-dependent hydrolase (beta-lactamase superfamily II)
MRKLLPVAFVLFGVFALAQQNDFSKVQIKVQKVAGTVYMLQGAGGNIGVSVGEDGIVIVDDQFAPLADKIQAALKGITDKPVRFVLNTHWHGDHVGGNEYFGQHATIIAQDNVRKRMEEGGTVLGNAVKPYPKGALPIITFEHDTTVHLNGEDIRALHITAGHTDGDSIIFFPQSNVVHMGDDFVTYGFPFIDLESGGSVKGMIQSVETAIAKLPPDVKVIPGHGNLSTLADVRNFTQMLRETSAIVQKGIDQGKTLDQLQQEKVLAAYDKKWGGQFVTTDKFIETLYNDLTGKKTGEFVKHN